MPPLRVTGPNTFEEQSQKADLTDGISIWPLLLLIIMVFIAYIWRKTRESPLRSMSDARPLPAVQQWHPSFEKADVMPIPSAEYHFPVPMIRSFSEDPLLAGGMPSDPQIHHSTYVRRVSAPAIGPNACIQGRIWQAKDGNNRVRWQRRQWSVVGG